MTEKPNLVLSRINPEGSMYPGIRVYLVGGISLQKSGLEPNVLPIERLATRFTRAEVDLLHALEPDRAEAMGFEVIEVEP